MKQNNSKNTLLFILLLFIVSLPLMLWLIPEILQVPLREQKNTFAFASGKLFVTYSAMKEYSAEYGEYPSAEKWCDLILPYLGKNQKYVLTATKNRFALNPNAKPDSPENVVLLFESTGHWNASGKSELLAPESNGRPGCYIVFNNGEIKFISPEQSKNLNWGNKP